VTWRRALGLELLALILETCGLKRTSSDRLRAIQRIQPILQYVRDHLREDLGRSRLAERLNLSPTRFHLVFTDAMGVAPVQYVKALRLRQAQRLLIKTDLPIAEVASQVGYEDPFHFSRAFKAQTGANPSDYRRLARPHL
jgi:transcriptional regulator GlxA family with amidase domain